MLNRAQNFHGFLNLFWCSKFLKDNFDPNLNGFKSMNVKNLKIDLINRLSIYYIWLRFVITHRKTNWNK